MPGESDNILPAFSIANQLHEREHTIESRLRVLLHRQRPLHTSGEPDALPFRDAASFRKIFTIMDLPASYLQIADGSIAAAHARISHDVSRRPNSFEMNVYCVTKQGEWSFALSHRASTMDTSILCSLDKRTDATPLLHDLLHVRRCTWDGS